jgi:hypothetical protein
VLRHSIYDYVLVFWCFGGLGAGLQVVVKARPLRLPSLQPEGSVHLQQRVNELDVRPDVDPLPLADARLLVLQHQLKPSSSHGQTAFLVR